jgi:hypothetical protein
VNAQYYFFEFAFVSTAMQTLPEGQIPLEVDDQPETMELFDVKTGFQTLNSDLARGCVDASSFCPIVNDNVLYHSRSEWA